MGRVLIVDDEPAMRRVLRLRDRGTTDGDLAEPARMG